MGVLNITFTPSAAILEFIDPTASRNIGNILQSA